ncbi:MAG TPA: leucyl aminopeptidase, partial [Candidatus Saccharimonadales bacterium]|nr:leucyl aminopeptidase [Candidatus Saccharimonadales bacterium]
EARRAARLASIVCRATNLARDLVNEPALALTPTKMAEYASALAKRAGVECSVFDEGDLRRMGMGAFLGVASGSHQPPRMIHLHYRPEGTPVRKLAIVGKGLTFDSGGLSLKTATGMETMKLDKGGSAAVLATMLSLPELKPRVEVHGLMGMTENMPGGSAIKPGDVVRTCGGKTVEIINTDAEGRLVLADVLGYTRGLGADEVIDLATLTGACMVALGPLASGLFTDDSDFAASILSAAERAGEKFWRLPLYEEYREQLRSEIADIKNTGERYGGATTAALFLREFIGRDRRWAHLDIAGPAFLEQDRHAYMRKGATGAGVRTLLAYIADLSGRD